jgi:hypothetical protein
MQLTSPWLIATACLVTLGALAGVIAVWRRLHGRWWPLRVLGILLVEALALTTAAIAINQSGDFYPSWSSLAAGAPKQHLATIRPPALAGSLAGHAAQGSLVGYTLRWQPAGWTAWGLAIAPTVYLPPAYFRTPGLRLPVLIVIAPVATTGEAAAWDDAALAALIRAEPVPACVVVLRPGTHASMPRLGAGLPGRLNSDIGVAPHGWALVAAPQVTAQGVALFQAADASFTALALVGTVPPPVRRPAPAATGIPAAYTAARLLLDRARAEAGAHLEVAPQTTALTWAFEQLPPPLAPPETIEQPPSPTTAPPVPYLPGPVAPVPTGHRPLILRAAQRRPGHGT